jgi:hypothetical protein
MEPQHLPLRSFKSVTTSDMEDFISASYDIQHVTLLTRKAAETPHDQDSALLLRLYLENALITYARPFATGVRNRLVPEDIFVGGDGALEYHKYLIEQRNKLVAHNVNPFEQTLVGIIINAQNEILATGHLMGRLVVFTKDDYQQFNRLATTVLEFINTRLQGLEQEMLSQAHKLPPEERSKLETVKFKVPGPEAVTKSKRKM